MATSRRGLPTFARAAALVVLCVASLIAVRGAVTGSGLSSRPAASSGEHTAVRPSVDQLATIVGTTREREQRVRTVVPDGLAMLAGSAVLFALVVFGRLLARRRPSVRGFSIGWCFSRGPPRQLTLA